ncbi:MULTISPECIES: DUF4102 domain-containing protein [Bartonella]|uniref:DUF4102 domain-containing protein n=1 Tax=Bartonella TaxID=773 RepID=UPI0023622989|nr:MULTISPECIES: DUF4102 domain-containing protein [Bartonella]
MPLMNLSSAKSYILQTLGLAKYVMVLACSLIKRKDEGAQWIYHYIISQAPSRNGLVSVEKCFFKKTHE